MIELLTKRRFGDRLAPPDFESHGEMALCALSVLSPMILMEFLLRRRYHFCAKTPNLQECVPLQRGIPGFTHPAGKCVTSSLVMVRRRFFPARAFHITENGMPSYGRVCILGAEGHNGPPQDICKRRVVQGRHEIKDKGGSPRGRAPWCVGSSTEMSSFTTEAWQNLSQMASF